MRYRGSLGGSFKLDFQFSGAAEACMAWTGCVMPSLGCLWGSGLQGGFRALVANSAGLVRAQGWCGSSAKASQG